MNHPEDFCATITAALNHTGESWGFMYGAKPDQNFDSDEFSYPMNFMDPCVGVPVKNLKTNVREMSYVLGLLFAYKCEEDDTESVKLALRKKARQAAREFVLRLRAMNQSDDGIKDVSGENQTDVDHVFDINLVGVAVEITVVVVDSDSVCLT